MEKQRILKKNNIAQFYLSPYAQWMVMEDKIVFGRIEKEEQYVWEFDLDKEIQFFNMLDDGMNTELFMDKLSEIVGEENVQEWYIFMVQEGIIE